MADDSSDLELLDDVIEEVSNSAEDDFQSKKRTQKRAVYILDRTFETLEQFNDWWTSDESAGWHFTDNYTSKKTGVQTAYYK